MRAISKPKESQGVASGRFVDHDDKNHIKPRNQDDFDGKQVESNPVYPTWDVTLSAAYPGLKKVQANVNEEGILEERIEQACQLAARSVIAVHAYL